MKLRILLVPAILTGGMFVGRASAGVLRVCADPDYLPYSNRAGEGFENKIAEAVAAALGDTVEYTFASYRGRGGFSQFLATTLDAKRCDVVMDIPYGNREELNLGCDMRARYERNVSPLLTFSRFFKCSFESTPRNS